MENFELFDEANLNPFYVSDKEEVDNQDDKNKNKDKDPDLQDDKKAPKVNLKAKPDLEEIEIETDEEDEELNPDKTVNTLEDPIDESEPSGDKNTVLAWAKEFKEYGILNDYSEEELEDMPTLIAKLYEDKQRAVAEEVEAYKESMSQRQRELAEAEEEGITGSAFDDILNIKKQQVTLDKLDESILKEDKELQKKVMRTFFKKTTRFTDAKIEREISRLEDLEDLEKEASDNLGELKKILAEEEKHIKEQAKAQAERQRDNAIKAQDKLRTAIKNTKTVISDINITEGEKKELEFALFNPVGRDASGNPVSYLQKVWAEDPENVSIAVNYLAIVTKGFKDWSKITNKATTKAAKKIEGQVFNPGLPTGTTKNKGTNDDSTLAFLRKNRK